MNLLTIRNDAALRTRLSEAMVAVAQDAGPGDQIVVASLGALVEAVLETVAAAAPADLPGLLLPRIHAEGGVWSGRRAACALAQRGHAVTYQQGVKIMCELVERRQLVMIRPPRGTTFHLPFGPGGEIRYQWSTNQGGHTDPELLLPTSEAMARAHAAFPWHPLLLRREVRYGPWVPVPKEPAPHPAETEARDQAASDEPEPTGAFWADLNDELRDPAVAAQFHRNAAVIRAVDAAINALHACAPSEVHPKLRTRLREVLTDLAEAETAPAGAAGQRGAV